MKLEQEERDIIASASTVAMFLNQIAHAVALGARDDMIKLQFENAKVHWEYLSNILDDPLPTG